MDAYIDNTNSSNNKSPKEKKELSKKLELDPSSVNNINPTIQKEVKEETNKEKIQNTPKESISEPPQIKFTPLSQDAKPFDYKKIKSKNSDEFNNNNMNNEYNTPNNEIKRTNFAKKSNISMQSPLFSYFNDSQKFLSEQYGQNKIIRSSNQINKNALIKDNNTKTQLSSPIENIEENNQSEPIQSTPNYNDFNFFNGDNTNNNSESSPDCTNGSNSIFNNNMSNS
jgi:hypothetical protein